jgi:hypothetical protein
VVTPPIVVAPVEVPVEAPITALGVTAPVELVALPPEVQQAVQETLNASPFGGLNLNVIDTGVRMPLVQAAVPPPVYLPPPVVVPPPAYVPPPVYVPPPLPPRRDRN